MNRIKQLFEKKQENILSIFFTAGHPELNDTQTIIKELENAGVDLIEIGIPFSDPLADGPTIQKSSLKALNNGMTQKILFEQLKNIRDEINIPIILMGNFNPMYKFGVKEFCDKCGETGIDGIIMPDLPIDEYQNNYEQHFKKNQLENIFLITPQTTEKRIRLIDGISNSLIYMVSSSSTTGAKKQIDTGQIDYFTRIKNMNLKNSTLIGFGISNNETYIKACQYANGVIIGSAFVNAIDAEGDLKDNIHGFIEKVKGGI